MSALFAPSREDVREFFRQTWARRESRLGLSEIEHLALGWIERHPEYHEILARPAGELAQEYRVEDGQTNPFLHLSLHLALAEQLRIDQPPGIRAAFARLAARRGDDHVAAHEAIECLAKVLWEVQRAVAPADMASINDQYLECLARR